MMVIENLPHFVLKFLSNSKQTGLNNGVRPTLAFAVYFLGGKSLKIVISEIYQMFTKEEYMLAIVLLFLFKIMVYLLRNHFVVSFYFI